MAFVVYGDTLTDAWLADLEHLREHGGEQLNLITAIANPDPERADIRVIGELDPWLLRKGLQRVGTVANTIFRKRTAADTPTGSRSMIATLRPFPGCAIRRGTGRVLTSSA